MSISNLHKPLLGFLVSYAPSTRLSRSEVGQSSGISRGLYCYACKVETLLACQNRKVGLAQKCLYAWTPD